MSKDTPRNPKAQAQKDLRQEKQQLNAAEAAKRLAEERLELHVQFAVLEKDQREYELERRPESRLNPLVGLEDWIATYRHTRYKVEGLSSPIVLGQLNPEVETLLTTHPPSECCQATVLGLLDGLESDVEGVALEAEHSTQ